MGTVDYAGIYDSTMINATNPLLLELLIQFFKEFVHNPQTREH